MGNARGTYLPTNLGGWLGYRSNHPPRLDLPLHVMVGMSLVWRGRTPTCIVSGVQQSLWRWLRYSTTIACPSSHSHKEWGSLFYSQLLANATSLPVEWWFADRARLSFSSMEHDQMPLYSYFSITRCIWIEDLQWCQQLSRPNQTMSRSRLNRFQLGPWPH